MIQNSAKKRIWTPHLSQPISNAPALQAGQEKTLFDKSTSIFDLEKGGTKDLHLESTRGLQIQRSGRP